MRLPKKMSELLKVALADLKKAEASKEYVVDMGYWHTYFPEKDKCMVCLAGAVLAFSLGHPRKDAAFAFHRGFTVADKNALSALNSLRCGSLHEAYKRVGRVKPVGLPDNVHTGGYRHVDREEWYKKMGELVAMLEAAGD